MGPNAHTLGSGWDGVLAGIDRSAETLGSIRHEVRRERLLDMELRVRRYRLACFAILAVALALGGSDAGGRVGGFR